MPRGRKPDPSFDMIQFRADVAAIMAGTGRIRDPIPAAEPTPRPGAAPRITLHRDVKHALVSELQRKLGLSGGGAFDAATEAAVRAFQRNHDLVPDGIVGPKTWIALDADGVRAAASPPR